MQPRALRLWTLAQDRWSSLLGCPPEERATVVSAMMRAGPSERTGYWLQLALSVGIGTMGLVLDSGAVVIAAMLIAPLLAPIESLGMGLAIGSPFLAVRSAIRVVVSVAVAVGCSALLVRALPFQETTSEIVARTVPTALDLVTAAFCALAGVFSTMRPSSDAASAAAGTSIGISLVPPLCVCGYGIGALDWAIAGGAALLFVTNLVAIVVVATLGFAMLGFQRVDIAQLEREAAEADRDASFLLRVARRVTQRLSHRGGLFWRIAMPLGLLAVVYVPLRTALDEVAWQVRVRRGIDANIAAIDDEILESSVGVERNSVEVAVVLIGTSERAEEVRAALQSDISMLSGTSARVTVAAVPAATEVAGLADELRNAPQPVPVVVPEPPQPPPPPSPAERIEDASDLVASAVAEHWPETALGPVLDVALSTTPQRFAVAVRHHGRALDDATRELLERHLTTVLERDVVIDDLAIPSEPMIPGGDPNAIASDVAVAMERARERKDMWLCAEVPAILAPPRRRKAPVEPADAPLRRIVGEYPRLHVENASTWRLRFVRGGCDLAAERK